jgi:putative spermidine/putrescine transport system substrate-binding protein
MRRSVVSNLAIVFAAGVTAALALVPLALLALVSVGRNWFWPALLPRELAARAWEYVASGGGGIGEALVRSLVIALVVAIVSVAAALPAARAIALHRFAGKRLLLFALLFPVMAPPLAAAMGLHTIFLRAGLADSLPGVVLVHLIPAVPYATLMLAGAFANFDTDWEAQARTLGAGPWSVWTRVTLPALAPAVAVAAAFAFLLSWSQYLLTLLIGGGRVLTLPLLLLGFQRGGDEAVGAALALVFIAPTLIVFALVARVVSDTGARHESDPGLTRVRLRSSTGLGVIVLVAVVAHGCSAAPERPAPLFADDLARTDFAEIARRARGTTVRFGMWAGDEARNRFHQGPAADAVKRELGLTLEIVPLADVADAINKLLNEKSAGVASGGSIDFIWINGENFRTAKQGGLLWGPFATQLPNIRFFDETAWQRDFGTPTGGHEAPVEQAQFVLAYDSARVPAPPATVADLRAWIHAHPGRFTYPAIPDFTGSAFIRHVLQHAGGIPPAAFANGFDADLYERVSKPALAYLRDIKPDLWRRGETYPATPADLNRLFVNGEIDFSMNYGPTFASDKIARGEFPATVRTLVFDEGTIANYSYLAIPFNAANVAGALTIVNYFMSPAHALARARAIGGLFPLRLDRLSAADRAAVDALPRGPATLPLDELAAHRIVEADAEYLQRLERDWRSEVLQR